MRKRLMKTPTQVKLPKRQKNKMYSKSTKIKLNTVLNLLPKGSMTVQEKGRRKEAFALLYLRGKKMNS